MQVLLTSIGFTNFFRCLIFEFFFFTNADVVTIKDYLNKIRETSGGKIREQDLKFPTDMIGNIEKAIQVFNSLGRSSRFRQ